MKNIGKKINTTRRKKEFIMTIKSSFKQRVHVNIYIYIYIYIHIYKYAENFKMIKRM